MQVGDAVPSVAFTGTSNLNTTFNHYHGQWLVVYFYPRDATPGCTTEGCDFRDQIAAFTQHNTLILGVSRDSLVSHEKFKLKQTFPFELISDPEEVLCKQFDVIKMKSMYGKQVRGIERSTFLIDSKGIVRHIWRKVRVKNHVADVLNTLKTLQAG